MPSQPYGVTIEFDIPAKMRDGTVLRANVYHPAADGRWPVLLCRTPYGKDIGRTWFPDPVNAARQGYVVIIQDTRGRFRSEGEWQPFDQEAEDGVDTIAWAASLPYADGQVGMFGASYVGFTQWSAATLHPPALKAIIPAVTWADPTHGFIFRGGALELGVLAQWNLSVGGDVLARRHQDDPQALAQAIRSLAQELDALGSEGYWSLPLAEFAPHRRQGVAPAFFADLAAPPGADRYRPRTILGKHDQVQAAAFNIGGWYDIFLGDTLAHFSAMRTLGKPTKLLIGPWTHGTFSNPVGEVNFGFGAQAGFIDLQMDLGALELRWFDRWLKGEDNGVMDEPPIKLFVMGANIWRSEHEWPLARARNTPYYLRAGGQLSPEVPGAEPPDTYIYDPADPTPARGGPLLMTPEYPAGPFDQRPIEARPDVLVYRTPPLERDVEVTGPITVHLWAISSAPDTDFVARLTDVYPDGRSFNLADGILRARYRRFSQGEPPSLIEPGQPYEYVIDLWATSNVFKAGHRIGLQITSSCFPRWDRNPNTGHPFGADDELQVAEQTILHNTEHPSHVVLPLVDTA